MPSPHDKSKEFLDSLKEQSAPSTPNQPKCIKCSTPIDGGKFCQTHMPPPPGSEKASDAGSENDQQAAKGELPNSFALHDGEERIGRIYLKDSFTPKPGHFFSSNQFEDWEVEGLENLSITEQYNTKFQLIQNLNQLLADTFKEIAAKEQLDYKLVKGPNDKLTYQLINKDGSPLTMEQQRKLAQDMPAIFNRLSTELTHKLGNNIRLVMISEPGLQAQQQNIHVPSPLSTTPTPGQSQSTDKRKEEEEKNRAASTTSSYTKLIPGGDPKSITPKSPF